jgi:hypothetical protein
MAQHNLQAIAQGESFSIRGVQRRHDRFRNAFERQDAMLADNRLAGQALINAP